MAKKPIDVEVLRHDAARRRNIPTAEFESVMREEDKTPVQLAYERRNRDLDPQLVWRGKDEQDWSDLIVPAPPLYIQEKVHPKVIIDDLIRGSKRRADEAAMPAPDLFADFNGLKDKEAATEFYQHDQHWSNRMISGDSLSVMASLSEREGLRGKVQCIYFDPPYGIKFNSNFQWSTTSRDVKDGAKDHVTREPEQVRAFRDTWRDGIHSYLTYLRDRLTVARDLLTESGSIFIQIGDENVHRIRALMDEIFGEDNYVSTVVVSKTSSATARFLAVVNDSIVWFAKDVTKMKYRQLLRTKQFGEDGAGEYTQILLPDGEMRAQTIEEKRGVSPLPDGAKPYRPDNLSSQSRSESTVFYYACEGKSLGPGAGGWKTNVAGMDRLNKAARIRTRKIGNTITYIRFIDDFAAIPLANIWSDVSSGFNVHQPKIYVVQTNERIVERCILMTTDSGDLVLDPTCGSGTTADMAEHWGRRWIAIALARSRLMGARYPYYLLADSPEGQKKEGEVTRLPPKTAPTRGDIRHGFVYERVPHVTLKSIANNAEIDVIWERMQPPVEEAIAALNASLRGHTTPCKVDWGGRAGKKIDFTAHGQATMPSGEPAPANGFLEWEIPREAPEGWTQAAKAALARFWKERIARQREIDASIAAKAEFEYLYDKPFDDKSRLRVAGPFTVESLSPHRTLAVDWNDELIDLLEASEGKRKAAECDDTVTDFANMILENLKVAGVQQAHKEDRITFTSLAGWPGRFICAEATFMEGEKQKRAGIFIGPEFGTVSRPDLVAAAREAGDAGFDVLIACAFNYDAHSAEFDKLGRVPVLKARMNPDLHMGADLKATGAGNLFVIFGEPDIKIEDAGDDMIRVKVFGVDVFKPQTGEVISEGTDGIALWMLDSDYNEESFFVRHAYFLGANDPYKALKTTLKAEIDQEAWESLYSDTSRPFPKPESGRIAVKVINHLGDEVMKVFAVAS
jgi:adenine-specific DNA-methyltransferase